MRLPPLLLLPLVLAVACGGKTATWTGGSNAVRTEPDSCAASCCNVGDQPSGCTGGPLTEAQCVSLHNRALAEMTCSDEQATATSSEAVSTTTGASTVDASTSSGACYSACASTCAEDPPCIMQCAAACAR